MKKLLIIALAIISGFGLYLYGALDLPINRPSREFTDRLDQNIKDVQDLLNTQKPVAAQTYIHNAEDELRRVQMYLSPSIRKKYEDYIDTMRKTIQLQKDFQMKTYGKLLEVN